MFSASTHNADYFLMFQEIFSSWSHKTDHFQKINRRTNIPYTEMLFFDDEDRNIHAVRSVPLSYQLLENFSTKSLKHILLTALYHSIGF